MSKSALERIESHEKLCRIMQKQTHDRIHRIEGSITRIERILIGCAGGLLVGMGYIILELVTRI
jgi:hypothetical protein|tara:strand:+ start:5122 stop:5313 length:192 start_codon:yes stop_codon:yes gene_type:complete